MPLIPAHVKLSRKKAAAAAGAKGIGGAPSESKEVDEAASGVDALYMDSAVDPSAAYGENSSPVGDLEEKGGEGVVGIGEKGETVKTATTSSVFAALNAHAEAPQTTVGDGDQDAMIPATTSSASAASSSSSVEKLALKRTLLYPMQGVVASENNDGMAPAGDGGNQQDKETKFVAFDLLQTRNVSLAKGMVADEKLNAEMSSVMLQIIQENRVESSKSLDDAVRSYGKKGGGAGAPGKKAAGGRGGAQQQQQAAPVNGGASNSLKNLLKIAPGASSGPAGPAGGDLSFNGGMNILDMLKSAKTASGSGSGGGGKKGGAVNWQQETLMQQTAKAQQQQQHGGGGGGGGNKEEKRRASKAYEAKQQQLVKAHLQSAQGKEANYAASAAFHSPDASEVPMPDFTGDMREATFKKGGFFDS